MNDEIPMNIIKMLGVPELIANKDKFISITIKNSAYIGKIMTWMNGQKYSVFETSFDNDNLIYVMVFVRQ